ncbi:MAG: DNA gyrase subunit A [Alphaproteobacteria bacterium]
MSDNEDDLPPESAEASDGGNDGGENGLGGDTLPDDIAPVSLVSEMRKSYLDYAMSVIVSRALPDVRDGLKPVHRRILYTAKTGGYEWNRAYRKSANLVGEVMGGYHPHGDGAIYDAMVRMAQPFSMRAMLIDGQGNFGSMDGDPPAAYRYTEARLSKLGSGLLEDIDKNTVDFQPNYDESKQEPQVLPAPYPNLLVNGAGGIAVGMATNIPPHNLREVINACAAYIDNPSITIDELMELIPGPDFPTGAMILGRSGIRSAYHTGRGSVIIRAKTHIEENRKDRETIVVTELPYQVNKARLVERIVQLAKDKIVEGVASANDESDRHGMRVVIEVKRDHQAEVVLNQLFKHTPLQSSFGCNMLAINGGRPEMLNLQQIISAFVDFREEVITRRMAYELGKARDRAHILVGLAVAVANIDDVIALIRHSADPTAARIELMERAWPAEDIRPLIELLDEPGRGVSEDGTYKLSEEQARGILALQLSRLTGLERDKIASELEELAAKIKEYLEILSNRDLRMSLVRSELLAVAEEFGDDRRTSIENYEADYDIEDLIPREDMVVTVSHGGYVKRVALDTYRAQRRGGKGRSGMSTRDEDFVANVMVCNTHTPVLFFSSRGMVYKLKVWRLPEGTPQARGKAMVNILPLEQGETITAFLPLPEDEDQADDQFVMFSTASGGIRRNRLSDFVSVKANGKIAMKLDEGDSLVNVAICTENQDVLLSARGGKAIRFPVTDVRVFVGRDSTGVRGMNLASGDRVISMAILNHVSATADERDAYVRHANAMRRAEEEGASGPEVGGGGLSQERLTQLAAAEQFILTLSEDGLGKRTSAYEYRTMGRGNQGVAAIDLGRSGKETAFVAASFPVQDGDQLMLVTNGGTLIRTSVDEIRIAGRSTRGVYVFRVADGEQIVSVARLDDPGSSEEDDGDAADVADDATEE